MSSDDVTELVTRHLAAWQLPLIEPGSAIGIPWSAERYGPEIARLRAALVTPYEQRFVLREHDIAGTERVEGEATYWVVASTGEMYLWYDEATGEYGVGEPARDGGLPVSIGLRGDIVGSFCAW